MADHNGAAANTSENRSLLPSQPQSYCTAALKVTVITISQIILNGFCAMNDKKVWPILFNLRTKLRPSIQDLWGNGTEFLSWINGSFVFVTSCQVYATWIVIVNSCQAGERSRCIGNSIWRQVQCSRYKAEDKVHRFWLEASPSTRTNKILKSLKDVQLVLLKTCMSWPEHCGGQKVYPWYCGLMWRPNGILYIQFSLGSQRQYPPSQYCATKKGLIKLEVNSENQIMLGNKLGFVFSFCWR